MTRWTWVAAAVLLLPFLAQPAQAQVSFGPQLAWGDDTDLGIGGRAEFGLADAFGIDEDPFADLFGMATATYFFWDCDRGFDDVDEDCSYFEINGNAAVPFEVESSAVPYAGAGLHIGRLSVGNASDTEVGLNLLGGVHFPLGALRGFGEAKLGLGGADQFVIAGGVMFGGGS